MYWLRSKVSGFCNAFFRYEYTGSTTGRLPTIKFSFHLCMFFFLFREREREREKQTGEVESEIKRSGKRKQAFPQKKLHRKTFFLTLLKPAGDTPGKKTEEEKVNSSQTLSESHIGLEARAS